MEKDTATQHESSFREWGSGNYAPRAFRPSAGRQPQPSGNAYGQRKKTVAHSSAPAPLPDFRVGQSVIHNAFGKGNIVKMTPMGGDQLIEIQFDSVGNKKLMLKAASRFLRAAEEG